MKRLFLLLLGALFFAATTALAAELGETTVTLDGREVASAETTLGNFVADAVRASAGTDIAVLHAMAFRGNAMIPQGVVDDQAIRNSLASPTSKITVMKLTPAVLRAMMQRALNKYPDPNMAFLQISGMDVTFDSAKPAATRVMSIKVNGKAIDFSDTKTTYTVAMPRELALGAVGYLLVFTDDVTKTMEPKDTTVLDAITQELENKKRVTPVKDGRLTDRNAKK